MVSGLNIHAVIDLENYSKKCIDEDSQEWYFLQYLKAISAQRIVSSDNPYYDIIGGNYACYFKFDNIDFSNYDPETEANMVMIIVENNLKYEKIEGGTL